MAGGIYIEMKSEAITREPVWQVVWMHLEMKSEAITRGTLRYVGGVDVPKKKWEGHNLGYPVLCRWCGCWPWW